MCVLRSGGRRQCGDAALTASTAAGQGPTPADQRPPYLGGVRLQASALHGEHHIVLLRVNL